jgi:hypothetical protein
MNQTTFEKGMDRTIFNTRSDAAAYLTNRGWERMGVADKWVFCGTKCRIERVSSLAAVCYKLIVCS